MFDVTILADKRYLLPRDNDWYVQNILLEDQIVSDALKAEGLKVNRIAWDDPNYQWTNTKSVLFRAVWDYFDRYGEFRKWFDQTSKLTRFINSKNLIDWNIDKHYLQDLNERGINIARTFYVEQGQEIGLDQAIKQANFKTEEVVLKPCISGAARHTYKFKKSDWQKHNTLFRDLVSKEAMMLQEFQNNVVLTGEASLMVFNGRYSHAVLKKAKENDFRVQDDFGGTVEPYKPDGAEIAFAEAVFQACDEVPLYGRADIFRDNTGKIALAELEIFEPELWFRFHPNAATDMAGAIKSRFF